MNATAIMAGNGRLAERRYTDAMKFDELEVGTVVRLGPVTVEESEMLEFARRYDPQWFHVDAVRAAASRWDGLIASGFLVCGLAMRLVADGVLRDSESFGSPGLEKLRWIAPVRANDILRLELSVDSRRRSASKPGLGILGCTWRMYNQSDVEVFEVQVTNLFQLETATPN